MIFRYVLGFLVFNGATAGFIDMDTPLNKRTATSLIDGTTYHLVSFAFINGLKSLLERIMKSNLSHIFRIAFQCARKSPS